MPCRKVPDTCILLAFLQLSGGVQRHRALARPLQPDIVAAPAARFGGGMPCKRAWCHMHAVVAAGR